MSETNVSNENQIIVKEAVQQIENFVKLAIESGCPSMVILKLAGQVDWDVNGIWMRDLELKITPPYGQCSLDNPKEAIEDIWNYGLAPLDFISPVPHENIHDFESFVIVAESLIAKLNDSVKAFPYLSRHYFSENGVSVCAELLFKP